MNKKVNIVEIGPRDGFQSVKEFIPTDMKIKIIEDLLSANIKKIQIGSFVSPKAIEQMKDIKEVYSSVSKKSGDAKLYVLVPNMYGAKAAYEAGLREVAYVISVSTSHNKANVNRTLDESFSELEELKRTFPDMKINLDVATAFGCPFEGLTKLESLMTYLKRGYEIGIRNFNICDTIGVADPKQVNEYVSEILNKYNDCEFDIHIHDTRNMGILNTLTAIECGIKNVQVSIGGLGGCPFAPGASGNTSTEDLIYLLDRISYDTGVDFEKVIETAKFAKENIKGNFSGHHINIDKECLL